MAAPSDKNSNDRNLSLGLVLAAEMSGNGLVKLNWVWLVVKVWFIVLIICKVVFGCEDVSWLKSLGHEHLTDRKIVTNITTVFKPVTLW